MTVVPKHDRRLWWLVGPVGLGVVTAVSIGVLAGDAPTVEAATAPCGSGYRLVADFGDAPMRATAISSDGRFVAGVLDDPDANGFGLWHDGEYTEVTDVPERARVFEIADVTDAGAVLGRSDVSGGVSWVYDSGDFRVLSGLNDSPKSHANAISDDGVIVGRVPADDDWVPAMWQPGKAEPRQLPTGDAEGGEALDIDADGTAVGYVNVRDNDRAVDSAWLWHADGTGEKLLRESVKNLPDDWASRPGSAATVIAGDWVLVEIETGYLRLRLSGDRVREELPRSRFRVTIDATGRVFRTNIEHGTVHGVGGDEVTLPQPAGVNNPSTDTEIDWDLTSQVKVRLASRYASVIIGKHPDGNSVMWTCR